jgi:hypothetical protein
VAVAADDEVDAPFRPQHGGELLVGLEADVGEQDGEVDVVVLVGVADLADLGAASSRLTKVPILVELDGVHRLLGEDADEEDVEPGLVDDVVGRIIRFSNGLM